MTSQLTDDDAIIIPQGKNWSQVFQWLSETPSFVQIENITQSAPCVVTTTTAHGLKDGWIFTIEDCKGMPEVNSSGAKPYVAVVIDSHNLKLSGINALNFGAYSGGGVIRFYEPMPLDGLTPSAQLRSDYRSAQALYTFASPNLIVDSDLRQVTMQTRPSDSADWDFETFVFDLELADSGGGVPYFANGTGRVQFDGNR